MYNPNYGGYQFPQMTPQYQPPQPQFQPAPQPLQSKLITVYVNGIEEAKGYTLASNTTAYLIDTQSPTIYTKITDANGFATFKEFEVKEKTETPPVEYVTKEEYQVLLNKFEKLEKTTQQSKQIIQQKQMEVNTYE